MKQKSLCVGNSPLKLSQRPVKGEYVSLGDEVYYKICNYDQMPPFFIGIVSDSDHWMFLSTNGALTAGRRNPDAALFPYYTDDKIQDAAEISGGKTILIVETDDRRLLWEPFSERFSGLYEIERNCYKNTCGNKIIFEEINHDLQICFQYAWLNSEQFGFIKKSTIVNQGPRVRPVNVLDGIQNILPYGVMQRFQNEYSTLVDAYKRNELIAEAGLGVYSLTSIPVDKAEPSEAMKATTVWSAGLKVDTCLLSSQQLAGFRRGAPLKPETEVLARRGAYFVNTLIEVQPDETRSWYIAADVEQDSADVANRAAMLRGKTLSGAAIEEDITRGTENLIRRVAGADGLQKTADRLTCSRAFSNVLFNIMRGGVFDDNYHVDKNDFVRFVRTANKAVYQRHRKRIEKLGPNLINRDLIAIGASQSDPDLERLCYEYLPLSFSRRHGDPSRPWNHFSIEIKDESGERSLNYQGNWRDIFQNWEALALSFPEYIEGMVVKFANATTADGYNPYRVTRDGFDWEVLDPADSWSYIGYWGDHQIIYLLKLLELSHKYHPGAVAAFLKKDIFTYANVPYRIKPYAEILIDPQNTIDFDNHLNEQINALVGEVGQDGKYLHSEAGGIHHVNLTEKLLVQLLVKLSNFIPEAGIWMNTQRPEWNDANNALVGNGVSMVTLYYLRRHLSFCRNLFAQPGDQELAVSNEVAEMFFGILEVFNDNKHLLNGRISDSGRKSLLDRLGTIGSDYRRKIYGKGFPTGRTGITPGAIREFCTVTMDFIDHTIRANKRDDKLYHAYNLISVENGKGIAIRHLYEMLEGQVAVLSSGILSTGESLDVLEALRRSKLFREDQYSYLLYPNRQLSGFIQKNRIPKSAYDQSELLKHLVAHNDRRIVIRDNESRLYFNGAFRNAADLAVALDSIGDARLKQLAAKEKGQILDTYEAIFDHQSFTGRSGTFYKYEGLGSIYWHMVSKLLLAVQETYFRAVEASEADPLLASLISFYREIKTGIGVTKSPELYGAFPTDPYSHTPAHAGAQQPGMTGQVKEDIISRFAELGVLINDGKITFYPGLLNRAEFLTAADSFSYVDISGQQQQISLEPGSLAFTLVQVPVIYHIGNETKISVSRAGGQPELVAGLALGQQVSSSLFKRSGEVQRIDVFLSPDK